MRIAVTGVWLLVGLAWDFGPAVAAESPPRVAGADVIEMVLVPAGPFIMGSLEGEPDEAPPRVLTLPAFYIDKYEVTHEHYAKFVKATDRKPPIDWPGGT